MITGIVERIRQSSSDSFWELTLSDGFRLVGYVRTFNGDVAVVPGKDGYSTLRYHESSGKDDDNHDEVIKDARELTPRKVRLSALRVGDSARIIYRNGHEVTGVVTKRPPLYIIFSHWIFKHRRARLSDSASAY